MAGTRPNRSPTKPIQNGTPRRRREPSPPTFYTPHRPSSGRNTSPTSSVSDDRMQLAPLAAPMHINVSLRENSITSHFFWFALVLSVWLPLYHYNWGRTTYLLSGIALGVIKAAIGSNTVADEGNIGLLRMAWIVSVLRLCSHVMMPTLRAERLWEGWWSTSRVQWLSIVLYASEVVYHCLSVSRGCFLLFVEENANLSRAELRRRRKHSFIMRLRNWVLTGHREAVAMNCFVKVLFLGVCSTAYSLSVLLSMLSALLQAVSSQANLVLSAHGPVVSRRGTGCLLSLYSALSLVARMLKPE